MAGDVRERLLHDPLELAARGRVQLADVLDGEVERGAALLRPAARERGDRLRQRQRLAAVRAQPDDDLARLARRLAGVLREPARLQRRALGVALDPARQRQRREPDPRHRLGQRVVHLAREPRPLLLAREPALLRGELLLGLGLAVEQPPRRRAGGRGDEEQRGLRHELLERVGPRAGLAVHDPEVDGGEQRARQRGAGAAVEQAAEQRRGLRVVDERAVDAGQQQDHRGQHELAREPRGMAHEAWPDPRPEPQRHERRRARRHDRADRRGALVLVGEREQRHEQDARAHADDQLAGRLEPAAGAVGTALADAVGHRRLSPGARSRGRPTRGRASSG